mmetsp:Transcript_11742/g.31640  ORF Transcript_11742/g.31640 Transcript_11742/m.31640 type:complete len:288 (-) Transcript_11742:326-1189(-)
MRDRPCLDRVLREVEHAPRHGVPPAHAPVELRRERGRVERAVGEEGAGGHVLQDDVGLGLGSHEQLVQVAVGRLDVQQPADQRAAVAVVLQRRRVANHQRGPSGGVSCGVRGGSARPYQGRPDIDGVRRREPCSLGLRIRRIHARKSSVGRVPVPSGHQRSALGTSHALGHVAARDEPNGADAPLKVGELSAAQGPVVASTGPLKDDLASVIGVHHYHHVIPQSKILGCIDHLSDGVVHVVNHRAHRTTLKVVHERELIEVLLRGLERKVGCRRVRVGRDEVLLKGW